MTTRPDGLVDSPDLQTYVEVPHVGSPGTVIQRVMNLVMPLKDPSPEGKADLVMALAFERDAITTAMDNVGSVHFARFNIIGGDLHLIAVFDGTPQGYIREFALQMGRTFDVIMERIAGWPPPLIASSNGPVSVASCPAEFVEWALRHDVPQLPRDPADLLNRTIKDRTERDERLPELRDMLRRGAGAVVQEEPQRPPLDAPGVPGALGSPDPRRAGPGMVTESRTTDPSPDPPYVEESWYRRLVADTMGCLDDVQRLVLVGNGSENFPGVRYYLLHVEEPAAARELLLADGRARCRRAAAAERGVGRRRGSAPAPGAGGGGGARWPSGSRRPGCAGSACGARSC